MVCKKCGAHLLEDDQFCPECGAKVIRKKRCPECGEALREGTRFCPSCGTEVGEARDAAPKKKADPEAAKRREDSEEAPRKRPNPDASPRKKANPAPPPKTRPVQREEPRRRRDWEEEDWDDDDDDEESVDVLSIMTVAVGCILLVIVAVLGFNLYQRYVPKDYEETAQEQEADEEEQEEGDDSQDGQILEERQEEESVEEMTESSSSGSGGTLVIKSDVRIRDNPSTQGTNVIRVAKAGENFEFMEAVENGTWYKVILSGEEGYDYGYIFADYIELQ